MHCSHSVVRIVCCAIAVSACVAGAASAQTPVHEQGEGTYTGDLGGDLIVTLNDRQGMSSLTIDGVLYRGGKDTGTHEVGFENDFAGGSIVISDMPYFGEAFDVNRVSTGGHVLRFQGLKSNQVVSGTWTLTYDPTDPDCDRAISRGHDCNMRSGSFSVSVDPVDDTPSDPAAILCGAMSAATAALLFVGFVGLSAMRRRRRG